MSKFRIVQMRNLDYTAQEYDSSKNIWYSRFGNYKSLEIVKLRIAEEKIDEEELKLKVQKQNEDREIIKIFSDEGVEIIGAETVS